MRGIGLLALLIVVAIAFYLMFGIGGGGSAGTALTVKKEVEPKVQEFAGRDTDGRPVLDTIAVQIEGKALKVYEVLANGAFERKYGLRKNDLITEIGPFSVKDQASDDGTAKAFLHDAYRLSQDLVVERNGQRITLPRDRNMAITPSTPTPEPTVQTPAPASEQPAAPVQRGNAKKQALDVVKQIESH